VLESLESSEFALLVRSELWAWPLALTVHALGTALVVGFVLIIGLRLLGLFEQIPYTSLNRLFPVVWVALVLQFASGFILWTTRPTRYVADGAFVLKLALIIAGIILTFYFQGIIRREAASWEAKGAVSSRVVKFVAATLIVWCSVVIAGRLTGYLGSIDIG
jgi:predicted ABC-type exoprotein transport system permease subunit